MPHARTARQVGQEGAMLLNMAATWDALADAREKQEAKKKTAREGIGNVR
jgi:hypothetical protein